MTFDRRGFLAGATAAALASTTGGEALATSPATVTLPMENGTRPLVAFPQKRPLIRLSPRPPLLETPFSIFDEGVLTPNNAFYVRWHLSGIPLTVDGEAHRIRIHGMVKRPLSLSVADLRKTFKPVEIVAVNQCSGNSRGLFSPRVPGGQWDNGAMGNARWTGPIARRYFRQRRHHHRLRDERRAVAAVERLSRAFGRAGLVCDVLDENAQRHRGDRDGR